MLENYIKPNGLLIKFDLTSGYHHADILDEHQDYLGLSWVYNSRVKYLKFPVLTFELSSTCNIFTKLLKPILSKWRSSGMKAILYLDDGVVTSQSKDELKNHALITRDDLKRCSLSVNEEKSSWYS